MSILKTISLIGSLLGISLTIISYIALNKIQKKFKVVTDDELITEEDERKIKEVLKLLIIGLIITSCTTILSLILKGIQLWGNITTLN